MAHPVPRGPAEKRHRHESPPVPSNAPSTKRSSPSCAADQAPRWCLGQRALATRAMVARAGGRRRADRARVRRPAGVRRVGVARGVSAGAVTSARGAHAPGVRAHRRGPRARRTAAWADAVVRIRVILAGRRCPHRCRSRDSVGSGASGALGPSSDKSRRRCRSWPATRSWYSARAIIQRVRSGFVGLSMGACSLVASS